MNTVLELWAWVLANSAAAGIVAVLLRESFADRHIHWMARVLGFTSWCLLACYSWATVQELRTAETVVIAQKTPADDGNDRRVLQVHGFARNSR